MMKSFHLCLICSSHFCGVLYKMWLRRLVLYSFCILCCNSSAMVTASLDSDVEICFSTTGIFKDFYPPLSPPDDDNEIVYDVSIGQIISRPIIAFVCRNGIPISAEEADKALEFVDTFSIRSIEVTQNSSEPLTIEESLVLCHYAAESFSIYETERYDTSNTYLHSRCSDSIEKNVLNNIPIHGNMLIAQGLFHLLEDQEFLKPATKKVQRELEIFIDDGISHITVRTSPFYVILTMTSLRWTYLPDNVHVNEPFSLNLEIVDAFHEVIESGLDSTLLVHVSITHDIKYVYSKENFEDFIHNSSVHLYGNEVITSYRNYDAVLHKRAKFGVVSFSDVKIMNMTDGVYFNATLLVPRSNFRQPMEYSDTSLFCHTNDRDHEDNKIYTIKTTRCGDLSNLRAVVHSKFVNVTVQNAFELRLIQMQKLNLKPAKAAGVANFNIEYLWVEVLDKHGLRVLSGPDSSLNITTHTEPSVCLLDNFFQTTHGLGHFAGAVCEVIDRVSFRFTTITVTEGLKLSTELSENFIISGIINLAQFTDMEFSIGIMTDPDPLSVVFARFAAEDINAGAYEHLHYLRGRKIMISVFNTDVYNSYITTTTHFMNAMKESESDRSTAVQGIIGFGWPPNLLLEQMSAHVNYYNLPVISIREFSTTFVDSKFYSTVTLLCSDEILAATSLAIFMQQKKWTKIVLISNDEMSLSFIYKYKFEEYGIQVLYEFFVRQEHDTSKWHLVAGEISRNLEGIKTAGTNIVLCYVFPLVENLMFDLAVEHGVSPLDGYQWISIVEAASMFPWFEHIHACKPLGCIDAMKGMILFLNGYNLQHYFTSTWFNVILKWFTANRALYEGVPTVRPLMEMGQIALGYDAVYVYACALNKLIEQNTSITTSKIVTEIRNINIKGITGNINFREGGGRRSYMAILQIIGREVVSHIHNAFLADRWLILPHHFNNDELLFSNEYARKQRDITIKDLPMDIDVIQNLTHAQIEIPFNYLRIASGPKPRLQQASNNIVRYYLSIDGLRNNKTLGESEDSHLILRTEYSPSAFICSNGCGGKRSYIWLATQYSHGQCINKDTCKCKRLIDVFPDMNSSNKYFQAYTGIFCEHPYCGNCKFGTCDQPNECKCMRGWIGDGCADPICKRTCVRGQCVAPNVCQCDVGYHGSQCNIFLGITIIVIVATVIATLLVIFFIYRWNKKRKQKKILMHDMDWLVIWEEVEEYKSRGAPSFTETVHLPTVGISTILDPLFATSLFPGKRYPSLSSSVTHSESETLTSHQLRSKRTVIWKETKCYAKKFERSSLDLNSVLIRREIAEFRELVHPNIVQFVGACLKYPNVALLLEFIPKGSLSEVLANESFSLTWDFKYSLLKDICRGMMFLHESKIGSHGRLKSTNCLIDNRWTCKVSGFGVPLVRAPENIFDSEKMVTEETMRSMLWTAPEFLRFYNHLYEVGSGTKSGDMYSFGIIITEICTHKKPFHDELQIITISELVKLLTSYFNPKYAGIKRLLALHQTIASNTVLRPSIEKSKLPTSHYERQELQKLIWSATDETPNLRLTFKDVNKVLNVIRPVPGDLILQLIYMFEKQTNHLEEIVSQKQQEINDEKTKVENLMASLVPPAVVEQLNVKDLAVQIHENVSIFFSDVVGISSIASESKPKDLIKLLNDLYICLDTVWENFAVLKLQTIGEKYCIVSGLPTPSETHAEELAKMSLHILSSVLTFPVHHMPHKRLSIRIGIHAGSCAAGIVGINLPRYIIFGGDVATAEEMETSGTENHIHVSDKMAELLQKSGLFYLTFRGTIKTKTLKTMETYWLTGMYGFNKVLPHFKD